MSLEVRELTPSGSGAVSVLRISGDGALAALCSLSMAATIPIGRPSRLRLCAAGEELDETIVCAVSTREVELHLHGSPPLVRRVMQCLAADSRGAAEVETIEDLAHDLLTRAPCEAGARILLDQAEGALARALESLVELSETERSRAIDVLLERWRIARWALRPATVVIAGPANAGKSTLFNALLGERRAIVDAAPGTTRDLNHARARLGSWPVILVDTAGHRELAISPGEPATQGSIEEHGQALARAAREAADLVLWLEPLGLSGSVSDLSGPAAGFSPDAGDAGEVCEVAIRIRTFADRSDPASRPALAVSALHDPIDARKIVTTAWRAKLELPQDPWTPGAPVPFTEGLAREIDGLRRITPTSLGRALENLLWVPRAHPPPSCREADDFVASPPGSA